jgi:hypothetical protein
MLTAVSNGQLEHASTAILIFLYPYLGNMGKRASASVFSLFNLSRFYPIEYDSSIFSKQCVQLFPMKFSDEGFARLTSLNRISPTSVPTTTDGDVVIGEMGSLLPERE